MSGVVIVGAGHGGSQCAASLRETGYDGRVTLVSDESAVPYHKPPLSKAFLKNPEMEPQILRAESYYADHHIDLRRQIAIEAIDRDARKVTCADGANLNYDYLVLATGARPRIPPIPGTGLDNVFVLRTLDDATRLRKAAHASVNAVVIGGGFIGMEAAFTLAGLGGNVTVIEAAARILGRAVAPAISEHVHRRAEAAGMTILTSAMPEAIEGNETAAGVRLAGGERLPADLVIIGIGVTPDTGLAEAAGLVCDNGIAVNDHMQTSDPQIFAIGDCCSFHHWQADRRVRLESVQNATDQARHAARVIAGVEAGPYRDVAWFWSDQGDMKIQMAGLSFDPDRFLVSGDPAENAFAVYHFAGGRLIAVDTVNRAADHMLGRKFVEAGVTPSDSDILQGPARLKELFREMRAGAMT